MFIRSYFHTENIKLFYVSLGCNKNLVDTEKMLGLSNGQGIIFTDDETGVDVILINTCCFIGDAKKESVSTILEIARYKEEGNLKALLVAGCLAQRYKREILDEVPEVDTILGTTSYEEMATALGQVLMGSSGIHLSCLRDLNQLPQVEARRVITTGDHYASLKITEGCDKRCTYCIIPYLRGSYCSVPIEQLVAKAGQLTEARVRELILVAQETTLYGKDLYGEECLPRLLRELAEILGICWIRIWYCYPEKITDELIETIRTEEEICNYLDIPIRHASDRILKRMGRRANKEELMGRIGKFGQEIPDIAIRTTLISGFPGETESDHEELTNFVNEMGFERLEVSTYSAEEDTPAFSYSDQVPEEVKGERKDEIIELQQDVAFEHYEGMVNRVLTVLIKGEVVDEPTYVERTYMDAPNVDGLIFVNGDVELMSGDFVRIKVTEATEYDLIGEVCDESAQ